MKRNGVIIGVIVVILVVGLLLLLLSRKKTSQTAQQAQPVSHESVVNLRDLLNNHTVSSYMAFLTGTVSEINDGQITIKNGADSSIFKVSSKANFVKGINNTKGEPFVMSDIKTGDVIDAQVFVRPSGNTATYIVLVK